MFMDMFKPESAHVIGPDGIENRNDYTACNLIKPQMSQL